MKNHYVIHKGKIVSSPRTKLQRIRTGVLTALVTAIAVIVATMLSSPNAHADTNTYLGRLSDAGYTGPIDAWVNMGRRICTAQALAISNSLIALEIVAKTGSGIYTSDAYEIIDIADDELCPSIRSVA